MKTRLLARLLLVTGSTLPALLAGCGDSTSDDGTAQTSQNAGGSQGAGNGGSAGSGAGSGGAGASAGNGGTAGSSAGSGGSDAGAGGSAAGSGGSDAGAGGSDAGAGGSDAGAGGSDAGAGGTAGAGGSDAGSGGVGGSAAGNGGAGGNICVEIEVCKDGQITKVCADPLADPKPFTDCGNGTCVDVDTMCPGPGGAGGSDAGAGGSDAGSGGSDGGSGGMAGAGGSSAGAGGSNAGAAGEAGAGGSAAGSGGSGGSGGSPGVPCKEGGACVEDAWCGDSELGQVLHCQKGTYVKSDPGFADVKVCIEHAAGEPCLEDGAIELQPAITAEYNASCLGVQGAAEPPVQKASNGVERCCYQVFAVCVGRPLFLGVEMRIAALLGGGGWA